MTQQAHSLWKAYVLFAILIVAILVPRMVNLDHFATADEGKWVARSANFYEALASRNWEMTYQKEHPGVTIMWAGLAGYLWRYPSYIEKPPSELIWKDKDIELYLRSQGYQPLELLVAGRVFMVLAITMTLAVSCFFAARLFGWWPALLGFALIAFDPFHVALSRQLHLDALLSCMMLLSILAYLNYLYLGRRRRDLVIAALGMGLAWLTKLPGIYLVPFVTLLTFIELGRQWWSKRHLQRAEIWQVLWPWMALGIMGIGFFVLFWPSMWVHPIGTLDRILTATTLHVVSGHDKALFFNGELVYGDPGWHFYPITYLWRTTPIVLIGLALAGVGFIHKGFSSDTSRRFIPFLLLFVLVYTFFMTLGAKKFDRYLLPVYPVLDLVAGIGLAGAVTWLIRQRPSTFLAPGLVSVALLIQLLLMVPTYPYYLTYYNPLLGGLEKAPEVMQIGWGEGLDEAARYFNDSGIDLDKTMVITWYREAMFSYFFNGPVTELHGNQSRINELELLNSDYAVLYIHQWQRQLPSPEFLAFFDALTPKEVIEINGLDYAKIYDIRAIPLPEFIAFTSRRFIDWDGVIRLLAYELPEEPIMPGESADMIFHLGNRGAIEENLSIRVSLVNAQGEEVTRDDGWPAKRGTDSWEWREVWADERQLTLPSDLPEGYYGVQVGFYDSSTLQRLSAADGYTNEPLGDIVTIDYLYVGTPVELPAEATPLQASLGKQINLLGTEFDGLEGTTIRQGETVPMRLFWQANEEIKTDYTVFVHLIGPDGQIVSQADQQPLAGFLPTTFWRPGEIVADDYSLQLPPDAPLGTYQLFVGMYDLTTGQRLPISVDGQVIGDAIDLGPFTMESNQ